MWHPAAEQQATLIQCFMAANVVFAHPLQLECQACESPDTKN